MTVPLLVLHIGTAKTGSTAIQSALHAQRGELIAAGIAYLPGHGQINSRDLAAGCVGPDGDDDLLDELGFVGADERAAYLDAVVARLHDDVARLPADVRTIVLSSEHFHSRLVTPDMVRRLAGIVQPLADDVAVVCYLRPQADLIASFYSTYLRNGGCETFDEVGARVLRVGHPYADYDRLLSMWADVFGGDAIRPRIFGEFAGGGLLDDVASAIGAPPGLLRPGGLENPSISRVGQLLLLALNRAAASGAAPERLTAAREQVAAAFVGPGERWPPEVAAERQAPFADGNEAVRRRWFPDRAELFAPVVARSATEAFDARHVDALAGIFRELAAPQVPPASAAGTARRWRRQRG